MLASIYLMTKKFTFAIPIDKMDQQLGFPINIRYIILISINNIAYYHILS